ncbi:hypothetical protein KP78_12160 [Jeotgalibacillus soli]|uniref:Uncharacterized protein n=1 Tax=Jeotgalibacillus soli TaxID=889306 RepID=A0A0C2W0N5_9BACL|nr:hypothetical protein KP78_12160 [Jeotgalibacillus soli]
MGKIGMVYYIEQPNVDHFNDSMNQPSFLLAKNPYQSNFLTNTKLDRKLKNR